MRVFLKSRTGFAALALFLSAPVFAQGAEPTLDPESPMAPMPDINVEWPDIDAPVATVPGEPAPAPTQTTEADGERNYSVAVEGLDGVESKLVLERFKALSTLDQNDSKKANVAQIDRRAREDVELLDSLLRAAGYYDAEVQTEVATADNGDIAVKLIAQPGPLYKFETVDVNGLGVTGAKAPELREAFGVDSGEAVDADKVLGGEAALTAQLKAKGYPFSKVEDPEVVVDHETRTATLALDVQPGAEQHFGNIVVTGRKPPFGAKHTQRIARFRPGDLYNQEEVDDLKRALIATGLISVADVKPVPSATPGIADISVNLEPAPMRTIAGELGYGTGEGARAEVSWTHRNLIKPEGAVTFRGVAGTQEQYIGSILRMNNFRKRDQVLNARLSVENIDRDAYDARTIELGGNLERQTNIIWQKKWTWSIGAEIIATDERDQTKIAGAPRRTFFIGALPGTLAYDGSDNLLDPTKGFRLSGRLSPEVSQQGGSTATYARAQIDGSAYFPVGEKVVLAGRTRVGSIVGAKTTDIAPSRRIYAGGGGSVRGYGYQMIGPRDVANTPIGGSSVVEFAAEARIRFGAFGVVPFVDGGSVTRSSTPSLKDFRIGAGVGGRFYSSFGPIRIDVGTPLNRQKGDARVTVYVSLGQAF